MMEMSRSLLLFFAICDYAVLQALSHKHKDNFTVECSSSFTDKCLAATNAPSNVSTQFAIPRGESALYALEVAANIDHRFQFSVSYGILGYSIKQINGIKNSRDCKWEFYVASKNLFPPFTPLGFSVDDYTVPFSMDANVYITVGFMYKNTSENTAEKKKEFTAAANRNFKVHTSSSNVYVQYSIQSTHSNCSQLPTTSTPVSIPNGGSILSVMESAAQLNRNVYIFEADYRDAGYVITSIAGIANRGRCVWMLYYQEQGQAERYAVPYGPADFIPSPNGNVFYEMTYKEIESQSLIERKV